MEGQGNTPHPKEHPMTTIKRLLRRLDGYTLEAFNAPATRARTRGGTRPAEECLRARRRVPA
jgi:hypothetical protein